jgi:hypothetical protein
MLAAATAALPFRRSRAQTRPVIRIGVINDQSGRGGVAAACRRRLPSGQGLISPGKRM